MVGMKTKSYVSWLSVVWGVLVLFATCSSHIRQGGHQNVSPLIFTTFVRIVVELAELLQPSIPVSSARFTQIPVGTRCTVSKNDLCVWRRRSFPTNDLCFRTFEPRFQQHVSLCVEQNC